ncbi:MAG: hypothetical protein COB09_11280 [Thalassobium sp.]|nr:MAG: hypothetical protein COB09_11280 [Thalassobium sp.]
MMKIFDRNIQHRNWDEALSHLYILLTMVNPGEVISITGPSRSGKTSLINKVMSMLDAPGESDRSGYMNSIYLLADNDGSRGGFSTKSFIWDALNELRHPMYAYSDGPALTNYDRTSESIMSKALINALKQRKVRYVFFDEVQHVKYVSKDSIAPHAVMDSWKNLAMKAGVVLILSGSYPMLEIIRKSPHLVGRQHKVHLPRYFETMDDLNEFASIVKQFEKLMPESCIQDSLISHTRYLQAYTYGCIGLLRKWLIDAVIVSIQNRCPLDRDILERTRFSDDDIEAIGREILDGERMMGNSNEPKGYLTVEKPMTAKTKAVKKKNLKPFKAKPRRYQPGNRMDGDQE